MKKTPEFPHTHDVETVSFTLEDLNKQKQASRDRDAAMLASTIATARKSTPKFQSGNLGDPEPQEGT